MPAGASRDWVSWQVRSKPPPALDGTTHLPLGTGVAWNAAAQPQPHSVGTLDTQADQVIYYHEGAVYRYAHATNNPRGRSTIKELPVDLGALNDNSIAYTGIKGYEYGLYDHVHRQVLFIDKETGTYAGSCQLPTSAPQRTSFGVSYANGYFWLFDAPTNPGTWRSYRVLGTDGFGRSETRANLRRFFEIDTESTVIGTLFALAEKGLVPRETVAKAMADLGVQPEKVFPELASA